MLLVLVCVLLSVPAFAQGTGNNIPVYQTGLSPVTPGHVATFVTNGVVADSGPSGGGSITELGLTNTGTPFCINDAPVTSLNGYHQFCLGANALGGGILSYQAYGGATPLPFVCNINGTTSPCFNQISGQIFVYSNNALGMLSTATYALVVRCGVVSAGDAPCLPFSKGTGACADGGDVGNCVNSADGNKWLAVQGPDGSDVREYGAICTSDDSAIYGLENTAMGSADWPSGVSHTVRVPGCVSPAVVSLPNVAQIKGVGSKTQLTCPSTATTALAACWTFPSSIELDDFNFTCTSYIAVGAFAIPSGCATYIAQTAASGQIVGVKIRNVSIIGGYGGLDILNVSGADLDLNRVSAQYGSGVDLNNDNGSTTVQMADYRVHVHRCELGAYYCVDGPNTPSGSTAYLAPRNIYVQIDQCVGQGWTFTKGCADITGSDGEQEFLSMNCTDSNTCLENKIGNVNQNAVQLTMWERHINVTDYRAHDGGSPALQLPFENNYSVSYSPGCTSCATQVPDINRNVVADAICAYDSAAPRQNNFYYTAGTVYKNVTTSGDYLVLQAGTSGGSDPGSTAANTGIADGTAIVQYLGPRSTTAANVTCARVGALSYFELNLHVQGVAFGLNMIPQGSGPGPATTPANGMNLIHYGTVKITGNTTVGCLTDAPPSEFGAANGFVDRVDVNDSDCVAEGTGSVVSIAGLGASSTSVAWSNSRFINDRFSTDNGTGQAALRLNGGGVFTLSIDGGRWIGWNSAIYNQGNALIYLNAGNFQTLNTSSAGGVFTETSTSAGGIEILAPVGCFQQRSASSCGEIDGGSTASINGIMVDPPPATTGVPTTGCYPGEQALDHNGIHLYACHPAGTWNTAW